MIKARTKINNFYRHIMHMIKHIEIIFRLTHISIKIHFIVLKHQNMVSSFPHFFQILFGLSEISLYFQHSRFNF
ncbi:hypothetical protein VIGAN_11089500, partial [Vigna angularis var. angularis]